jgi:hypothetical protein
MKASGQNTADVKAIHAEVRQKREQIKMIEYRIINSDNLNPDTWTALIRTRNECMAKLELLRRKLELIRTTGTFNGYSQTKGQKICPTKIMK